MRYGPREVLRNVTLQFRAGQMTVIVGPNGAGKSTMLGIMAGLRAEYSGECFYRDRRLGDWPRRAIARLVSFVPQSLRLEFPFTGEQVVMMGRTPFCDGVFEAPGDYAAVERAMRVTDTLEFRARDFRSLSGGERQRVVLACALAQSPEFLLLDEPTTFLDLRHQVSMYRILGDLCRAGVGVVTVSHDLNIAMTYADRAILLNYGEVIADGTPREVLTPEAIERVFGVPAALRDASDRARPWIVYEP
jgi:ABC-type cobalamin/Fe3+-siderophores transport system ATPase subunit